jgi:hypothetical protein
MGGKTDPELEGHARKSGGPEVGDDVDLGQDKTPRQSVVESSSAVGKPSANPERQ